MLLESGVKFINKEKWGEKTLETITIKISVNKFHSAGKQSYWVVARKESEVKGGFLKWEMLYIMNEN